MQVRVPKLDFSAIRPHWSPLWEFAQRYKAGSTTPEHLTVAQHVDIYHALCGLNPVFAYSYRLNGFFYAMRHISAHTERLTNYFLKKDREGFTPEQPAESKVRELRAKKAMPRSASRYTLAIVSPFYKPVKRPEPRGVTAVLEQFGVAA